MAGQIIRRGDRKWLVRIYLDSDPGTGRRRYHNHTVNGSKKDAERYCTAALRSRDLGTFVEPARMSLGAGRSKPPVKAERRALRGSRNHATM